jgi:DNA-binding NtrC family response regulator
MQTQRPRLLVVDDDRAILTLVGTGVTCLDVLRALRDVSPQFEAVLMTGYTTLDAAVEVVKRTLEEPGCGAVGAADALPPHPDTTAPLIEVEREHIVRTLEQVHGNKAVAARLLGISRRAFYRQLERHGLHQRVPMTRRGPVAAAAG